MIKTIAICLVTATACATTEVEPAPTNTAVLWTVYTHASCNGSTTNATHSLCVLPSAQDVQQAGDAAVTDWVDEWKAGCIATQGSIGVDEGHLCLADGQQAPFGCTVDVVEVFQPCQL